MASDITSLIAQVNDLQEAVEALLLRRTDSMLLRHFLCSLHALDFRFLVVLEFENKVRYLERRYQAYLRPREF